MHFVSNWTWRQLRARENRVVADPSKRLDLCRNTERAFGSAPITALTMTRSYATRLAQGQVELTAKTETATWLSKRWRSLAAAGGWSSLRLGAAVPCTEERCRVFPGVHSAQRAEEPA
ncbi:hypothetical protein GQ600_831 [Phytophthora cactorum]|nr:hypothetical protein GQ600_831 [Phytophthora cactorum]